MKTKIVLGVFSVSLVILLWQTHLSQRASRTAIPPSGGTILDPAMIESAARATSAELQFHNIPWVLDLFEGFQTARSEKRPVFLYTVLGDPLDDC